MSRRSGVLFLWLLLPLAGCNFGGAAPSAVYPKPSAFYASFDFKDFLTTHFTDAQITFLSATGGSGGTTVNTSGNFAARRAGKTDSWEMISRNDREATVPLVMADSAAPALMSTVRNRLIEAINNSGAAVRLGPATEPGLNLRDGDPARFSLDYTDGQNYGMIDVLLYRDGDGPGGTNFLLLFRLHEVN